jgi:glycerol kinase
MQFQSDILNRDVIRPVVQETTALGAAYAAGLAVGFYSSIDELRSKWRSEKIWKPQAPSSKTDELYRNWRKAITRSFDWAQD